MLIGVVLMVAAGVALLAVQVDDWRRDFTTNVAETNSASPDPLLHPITIGLSVEVATEAVLDVTAALDRWTFVSRTDEAGRVTLAFVYTTRLFQFKDDVTVWIAPAPAGTTIGARSASRVGRGDLGQNPRTLRMVMGRLRERFGVPGPE